MWTALIAFFSRGVGTAIGKGVSLLTVATAVIAALTWLSAHRMDEIACLSWGTLVLFALLLVPVIVVIYLTRAGSDRWRE